MKRKFKAVAIARIVHIYPVPVHKEKKYLIRCESLDFAKQLMELIGEGKVPHPDDEIEIFIFEKMHIDGKTKVLLVPDAIKHLVQKD